MSSHLPAGQWVTSESAHCRRPRLRGAPWLVAGLLTAPGACWPMESNAAARSAAPVPGAHWEQYMDPGQAGFDAAALDRVFAAADSARSAAIMIVFAGRVVAAWGDVTREFRLHSVRKSLCSALVGIAEQRKLLNPEATLAELGIDDQPPLTESERRARVVDLISARSGVYHLSAYASSDQAEGLPERGSHAPGEHWYYNNWDFNVAESIVARATGGDYFQTLRQWLAVPLEMEDWSVDDGFAALEPGLSRWPAHTLRMSTRDLARFGLLMLRDGRWGGSEVVAGAWARTSTSAITDLGEGGGYGYMWWTYAAGSLSAEQYPHVSRHDVVLARGAGGHAMFLLRDADLVFVHRSDTDRDRDVRGPAIWKLVDGVLGARTGALAHKPALGPLSARPIPSALPVLDQPVLVAVKPEDVAAIVGSYVMGPEATARVFVWEDRPFVFVPGHGEGELFARADGHWTVRVVDGVDIAFPRTAGGNVEAMVLRLGDRELRATRQR